MNEVIYSTSENKYAAFERGARSKYNRRCINGNITGCGSCVGYCQYEGHPGFLTAKLRSEHECINKNCDYYLPKPSKKEFKSNIFRISDLAEWAVI